MNKKMIQDYIKQKTGFDVEFGETTYSPTDFMRKKTVYLIREGKEKIELKAKLEIEVLEDKSKIGELYTLSVNEMLDLICENIVEVVKELEESK